MLWRAALEWIYNVWCLLSQGSPLFNASEVETLLLSEKYCIPPRCSSDLRGFVPSSKVRSLSTYLTWSRVWFVPETRNTKICQTHGSLTQQCIFLRYWTPPPQASISCCKQYCLFPWNPLRRRGKKNEDRIWHRTSLKFTRSILMILIICRLPLAYRVTFWQ